MIDLKIKKVEKEVFLLTSQINNNELINNLILDIKKLKVNQEKITNVKGGFTGFESLVDNNNFHNFLKCIKTEINLVYKKHFLIKNAWANICKKNDEVLEHAHQDITAFCGILYLTEGGPGTFFNEISLNIEEKVGRFILFHPILLHSVKKIENDIERISVAFNMSEIKDWDNFEEVKFINEV
jgi:hypothetical protein